jgi:DNA-binding IclR family transcriptional regulator
MRRRLQLGRKRLEEQTTGTARSTTGNSTNRSEINRAARALEILTAFSAGDRYLGNVEIAQRTGIPRPTVSRITATLVELGYLNLDARIGKYEIGPRVLALSYSLMARLQIHTRARPLMEELARDSKTIVGLGILDGLNVVFIETAMGVQRNTQRAMIGFRVPVAFTAMGWSCLSTMNASERADILRKIKLEHPARASEIASNVKRAIADIWARGFCISEGALEPGSNAVSVPFLDSDGRQILAFNMTASDNILTRKTIETQWGPRLVKLAQQLRNQDEPVARKRIGR